jgi:hypothetical protein
MAACAALAIGAPGGTSAQAQSDRLAADTALMAEAWALLETRCTLALNDPDAYVATVSAAMNHGVDPFTRSPDGQILETSQHHDRFREVFGYSGVDGYRITSCGIIFSDVEGMMQDPYDPLYSQRWASALEAFLASRDDLASVGGHMPFVDVDASAGFVMQNPIEDRHAYAVSTAWGDTAIIASAEVNIGGVALHVVDVRPGE